MMSTPDDPFLYDGFRDLNSEEEERRLSARHGEAGVDNLIRSKRFAPSGKTATPSYLEERNNADTDADAAAAKEFDDKVRAKKSRSTLLPSDLKGSNGLLFIRRSFPAEIGKFQCPSGPTKVLGTGARSNQYAQKMNHQAQIAAAAKYSRSLMSAYRAFARDLFPSMAPEDVFLKVEDLGSKKEVKDFLQIMRDELRREYLEGIYGVEKARRILHELEYGLRQQTSLSMRYDNSIHERMTKNTNKHAFVNSNDVITQASSNVGLDIRSEESNSCGKESDEVVNADHEESYNRGVEDIYERSSPALARQHQAGIKQKEQEASFHLSSRTSMVITNDGTGEALEDGLHKDIITEFGDSHLTEVYESIENAKKSATVTTLKIQEVAKFVRYNMDGIEGEEKPTPVHTHVMGSSASNGETQEKVINSKEKNDNTLQEINIINDDRKVHEGD